MNFAKDGSDQSHSPSGWFGLMRSLEKALEKQAGKGVKAVGSKQMPEKGRGFFLTSFLQGHRNNRQILSDK